MFAGDMPKAAVIQMRSPGMEFLSECRMTRLMLSGSRSTIHRSLSHSTTSWSCGRRLNTCLAAKNLQQQVGS